MSMSAMEKMLLGVGTILAKKVLEQPDVQNFLRTKAVSLYNLVSRRKSNTPVVTNISNNVAGSDAVTKQDRFQALAFIYHSNSFKVKRLLGELACDGMAYRTNIDHSGIMTLVSSDECTIQSGRHTNLIELLDTIKNQNNVADAILNHAVSTSKPGSPPIVKIPEGVFQQPNHMDLLETISARSTTLNNHNEVCQAMCIGNKLYSLIQKDDNTLLTVQEYNSELTSSPNMIVKLEYAGHLTLTDVVPGVVLKSNESLRNLIISQQEPANNTSTLAMA